jgi:DNA-binding LacI/PurR family transcriptional regulator
MPTIYEVAKRAGVSPKTAARILAGAKGRPQNQAKVMAAAKAVGYVRNQQAANLRSGKSGLLGLIIPDIKNPLYTKFFEIAHDIALSRGYLFTLSISFSKREEEIQALRMCETNRVEGLVLNASEGGESPACDEILMSMHNRGIPIILAGRDRGDLPVDQTRIQNKNSIMKAFDYLWRIGRRKIGFIGGNRNDLAGLERFAGYEAGIQKYSLPDPGKWASTGSFTMESGFQQMLSKLALKERPDAIIAANDLLALGALRACRENGIRVPEEVSIIGFDDISLASLVSPSLTTLSQPQEQIARDAINLMVERLATKDLSHPRTLVYEAELVIRESA